jgi:hypothetical protein
VPGDRTGRFLYVADEDGGTILRFDVAGGAGKVTLALEAAQTGSPVCIVFRDADLRFRQPGTESSSCPERLRQSAGFSYSGQGRTGWHRSCWRSLPNAVAAA